MKIRIVAAGRARALPEAILANSYLERFDRAGRAAGLGPATIVEFDAGRRGKLPEDRLNRAIESPQSLLCCLDERGKRLASPEFAARLAGWREQGINEAVFLIGGADGIPERIREASDFNLSFGPMVFPHLLARVMLAEQLYRAASILCGTPYHRN